LPLRHVYRRVWDYSIPVRIMLVSAAVLLFATIWACLRLLLFQLMTDTSGLWSDFGGWLFPSIFIFMCWTALYHGFKYYRLAEMEHSALMRMASERNSAAAKAAQAESSAREAQLMMLRYQLNPHFLFNTLNAVQSLVTSRQTERATGMISALSDFLRYSLYTDTQQLVTVEQEIYAVNRYLQIEQARFGERLVVDISVADEALQQLMPSMLLQPLIENSIKYAVAASEEGGSIDISAFCDGTHLNLLVEDGGRGNARYQAQDRRQDRRQGRRQHPGQESAQESDSVHNIGRTGVGLSNIRQRMENSYGKDFDFRLRENAAGGVSAELRIPLFGDVAFG
jgi:two-component system LytT family sensor kinase